MKRTIGSVAVIVVACLLSGCGGGPSKSYVKEVFQQESGDFLTVPLVSFKILNTYSRKPADEKLYIVEIRGTYFEKFSQEEVEKNRENAAFNKKHKLIALGFHKEMLAHLEQKAASGQSMADEEKRILANKDKSIAEYQNEIEEYDQLMKGGDGSRKRIVDYQYTFVKRGKQWYFTHDDGTQVME